MKNIRERMYDRLPWFLKDSSWRLRSIVALFYIVTAALVWWHREALLGAIAIPIKSWEVGVAISEGEWKKAFYLLWGLLALVLQALWLWLLKSLQGGLLRVVTVTPLKFLGKAVYEGSRRINNFVVHWRSKGLAWYQIVKKWYWNLRWYDIAFIAPVALVFWVVVLLVFVLAQGLRIFFTAKAGEMLIEKIFVWFAKQFPGLARYTTEPVRKWVHNRVENAEKRLQKDEQDAGVANNAQDKPKPVGASDEG